MEDLKAFFRGLGVVAYGAWFTLAFVVPTVGLLYGILWFFTPWLPPAKP